MQDDLSKEMPSEIFRRTAKSWVEADHLARKLEEEKASVLSELIGTLGDIPHNRAEREVKASAAWKDYLDRMVQARTDANYARVRMKWAEMRFGEWQTINANNRREMGLSGL